MANKTKRPGRRALNDYRSTPYTFRLSSQDYRYQEWVQSQVEDIMDEKQREGVDLTKSSAMTELVRRLINHATEGNLADPVPVVVPPIPSPVDVVALKAEILSELQSWAENNLTRVLTSDQLMTRDEVLETVSDDVIDNILNGMERR